MAIVEDKIFTSDDRIRLVICKHDAMNVPIVEDLPRTRLDIDEDIPSYMLALEAKYNCKIYLLRAYIVRAVHDKIYLNEIQINERNRYGKL